MIKLNLGCGFNHLDGYINVDKFQECNPDQIVDLEQFPWPFEDNSVDTIVFNHSLEHLGESSNIFLKIIQEIYRISIHQTIIYINVPHPRHDNFDGDPTHVRKINPGILELFDQELNKKYIEIKAANSPLGIYLGVNFKIKRVEFCIDKLFEQKLKTNEISENNLHELMRTHNNVCKEIKIEWEVIKN